MYHISEKDLILVSCQIEMVDGVYKGDQVELSRENCATLFLFLKLKHEKTPGLEQFRESCVVDSQSQFLNNALSTTSIDSKVYPDTLMNN
jgi:hypothetical protein